MARIEVVIDGDQVPAVRDLFIEAGATGYTGASGVSGFGHHGHHQGRLLLRPCQPVHAHQNFEKKLVDVVGLYMNPPERAAVFCFDEKTQCQALDRTQPSLPMRH